MIRKYFGFGLVEILISLFLSSFIIIILINQYLMCKRHVLELRHKLDAQLDAQMVIDFMRGSIRHAGFTPCLNMNKLHTEHHSKVSFLPIEISPDEHSLTLRHMSEHFASIGEIQDSVALMTNEFVMKPKQQVLIADCHHAEVREIQQVFHHSSTHKIVFNKPLTFHYQSPVFIGEWIEERFYLAKNKKGKSGLFYHTPFTSDELTNQVNEMIVTLHEKDNKKMVKVILGFKHGKEIAFETLART